MILILGDSFVEELDFNFRVMESLMNLKSNVIPKYTVLNEKRFPNII